MRSGPSRSSRAPSRDPAAGATIHDVARIADVSLITVSRAFRTPELLSKSTLAKVQAAATQTGYVPNLMAGALKSSRTKLVAALVPTLMGQMFAEMVQALTVSLEERGYQVMLGQLGYECSREEALLRAIIGRRPDAIVITGIMHSRESRQLLAASRIPIVETWDYTPTPVDMLVGVSHDAIGAEVCHFLHRRGHRRLALVSGSDERASRRREGFLRAANSLGIEEPPVHLVPAPTRHSDGRRAMEALLSSSAARPDAVFCSSDTLALGVLTETRTRGLQVPSDLAVVGFGDLDFAATLEPSLTTVRIDGAQMGTVAAQMIFDRIDHGAKRTAALDLGFAIVERASA